MAKKINLTTINATSLTKLSNFNVALFKLADLKKQYDEDCNKVQEKIDELKASRGEAIDGGMSVDEAVAKYSTVELENKLTVLAVNYKTDCKPYKEDKKKACSLVPDSVFEGYVKSMDSVDGSSSEMTKTVIDFLKEVGVVAPEAASSKLASWLVLHSAGSRRSSIANLLKKGDYFSSKKKDTLKEDFIRCFLQYGVKVKGVYEVNADYTISLHDFTKDTKDNKADNKEESKEESEK